MWYPITGDVHLFFLLFSIGYYCGSVQAICPQPVFQAPPPHCPGETAVFVCRTDDSDEYHRTVWEVNEEGAPYGGCALLHYRWPNTTTQCGSFYGKSLAESPSKCFVSQFSVAATLGLNGTSVICHYVDGLNNQVRGTALLQVTGPIKTVVSAIDKSDVRFGRDPNIRNVMIRWTTSHLSLSNVTSYVYIVKVDPAAAPCGDSDNGGSVGECVVNRGENGFESKQLSLQLELGIQYTVTVRTINCGTQTGNDSDPVNVLLLYPDIPSCRIHAHYQNGSLFRIEIAWENLLSGYTDPLLEVDLYHLIFDASIISPISLSPHIACSSNGCSYMVDVASLQLNLTVANLSFALTASNAIGECEPALCNAFPIDGKGFVTVDSTTGPHVSVLVKFPPDNIRILCSLTYGPNSSFQTSSANVREKLSHIEYQPFPLVTGLLYHYNVSCSMGTTDQWFTASGSFTPGCFLMDLIPNGNNISFINPLCLEVPYGVVCYSGLLPGAVAVYVCKEDSILRGVISRVCGSSGVWSGQVPLCEQHMLNISTIKPSVSDSPTHTPGVEGGNVKAGSDGVGLPVITVVTVSVSAGIAMGITGCLIGALLHKAVMAHSKKKVVVQPNQSQTHTEPPHLYDEVTLTSSSLHQSVLQCSANEGRRNVIVTIPNDAYIDSSAIKRK